MTVVQQSDAGGRPSLSPSWVPALWLPQSANIFSRALHNTHICVFDGVLINIFHAYQTQETLNDPAIGLHAVGMKRMASSFKHFLFIVTFGVK